jgi:lipopolysaccharide/colanic/teichoic acid biosynthesis glycosyltransferase
MTTEERHWAAKPPRLRWWKRCIDLLLASILAILCLPLLILMILLLKLRGGPVFEANTHIGAEARPFQLRRFSPDTRLGELLAGLPQLFSVIDGTMSIVGPEPLSERDAKRRDSSRFHAYIECRPGLTGLSALDNHRVHPRERLERRYVNECSPRIDFLILVRTLFRVGQD